MELEWQGPVTRLGVLLAHQHRDWHWQCIGVCGAAMPNVRSKPNLPLSRPPPPNSTKLSSSCHN
eukprot:12886261-Prorocentrum_lima.AAC.1